MAGQSEVNSPRSAIMPTGNVFTDGEVSIIKANKNSFHTNTDIKIEALAIAGLDKGTIMLKNI